MPKTLSKDDPNLVKAVQRLTRSQYVWAALFVGLGLFTQFAAAPRHPFAGLPFIVIGAACLRWRDPALLAAVSVLMALSIVPLLSRNITLLGPDPLPQLAALGWFESAALVGARLLLAYMALTQFLLLRFLYGTAEAAVDDPDQPVIPEMVPNHTNAIARWARGAAAAAAVCALAVLFLNTIELESLIRAGAELGGGLGALALGLGFGAAFSPTDERPAALLGIGLGAASYVAAVVALLRLP